MNQTTFDPCNEQNRDRAVAELEAELADFCHDGLVELREHLTEGRVLRGSWAGCVISYRRGRPGSARRDREGRARNAFTVMWDSGWITDDQVARAVDDELARRARIAAEPRRRATSIR